MQFPWNRTAGPAVILAAPSRRRVTVRILLALALPLDAVPAAAQRLPDQGDASSATITEAQERTIGNRIMRDLRNDPAYVDDAEITDYSRGLGERLMSAADAPRRDVTYFV